MTAYPRAFTVYGSFYGSNELPEAIASFPTYLEAEIFVRDYPESNPIVEYDRYLIELTCGGLRFATYA